MSNEPRARSATELDEVAHEGAGAPSSDVLRWVAPERLTETFLPSYFHPKYDAIESSLADSSVHWVRLGDLVEQFSALTPPPSGISVTWSVEGTSNSLRISETQQPQNPPSGSFVLPDRAIILQPTATSPISCGILG